MTNSFRKFLRDHEVTPQQFYGGPDDFRLLLHTRYLEWMKEDRLPDWLTGWEIWLLVFLCLVVAATVEVWR